MTTTRRTTIAQIGRRTTVLLGVISLLAACSSSQGGGGATTTGAPAGTAPASMATETSAPSMAAGVTLEIATDDQLGDHVTGEGGMSLYVFLPDADSDGSACMGGCATNWPPLTDDASAGEGVTGELATITRDDGMKQVTLGGAPLYYFAGDEAAGDVNGQGVNDVWYVASPEGTPVGDDDAPGPEQSQCGGRYCY